MEDDALCPRCEQVPLAAIEDQGVSFLGCSKCFGLFVSDPDLFVYAEKSLSPRAFTSFAELHEKMQEGAKTVGHVRHCPRCRALLVRVTFGVAPIVVLDRCEEHGIWLDKTELNKVLRAARSSAGLEDEDEGAEAAGPLEAPPDEPPG